MDGIGPWIFATAVLLVTVWLAIRHPKRALQIVGFVVVLVVCLVGVAMYLSAENNRRYEERMERSRSLISTEQIDASDWQIFASDDGAWRVQGKLINKSDHTIEGLTLNTRVFDCAKGEECPAIGDARTEVYVTVPPGQARPIEQFILFSPRPVVEAGMWHSAGQIVEIRALVE